MTLNDPTFWQNFFPNFVANFAANFIVGVLIVSLIRWFWRKRNKNEAKVFFELRSLKEASREAHYTFVLMNTGRVAFKADEIYWHIFIEEASPDEDVVRLTYEGKLMREEVTIRGKHYVHYSNLLPIPVFPGRQLQLLLFDAILISIPTFYYFLSTAHGYFPQDLVTDTNGEVTFDSFSDSSEILSVTDPRALGHKPLALDFPPKQS